MDTLTDLASTATDFAEANGMAVVPAIPEHDYGPEVRLTPEKLGLDGFLVLAAKLGGGILYIGSETFAPDDDDTDAAELEDIRASHSGEIGLVAIAFVANGIVHFWEHRAPWFDELEQVRQDLRQQRPTTSTPLLSLGARDNADDDRPDEETRKRLGDELAELIVGIAEFRAAKPAERQRAARNAIPAGTLRWVEWDAIRAATTRADEMTRSAYAKLADRYDDLAAALLSDALYQQNSSPAGRRQAVEQFLTQLADGFAPPTVVRDEVYSRAQALSRKRKTSAGGLF